METKWDWEMQLGHQMLGSKKLAPRNAGILVPEVNLPFFNELDHNVSNLLCFPRLSGLTL